MSWLSERALEVYWKKAATDRRRFRIGNRVRVVDREWVSGSGVWEVIGDDTNRTPVRDPEPAYKLSRGSKHRRYAYESSLRLLEDDLA